MRSPKLLRAGNAALWRMFSLDSRTRNKISKASQKGDFSFLFFFMYDIQHCFICRPSVLEDAGIEPGTVATTALAVKKSLSYALYR